MVNKCTVLEIIINMNVEVLRNRCVNVWSKNGVYICDVCWNQSNKESKDKRLDSWGLREILKESNEKENIKRLY